jgi:hypothetical protein
MALINCPECKKEISDKTFKCPNCGVVINKPKRGITGIVFKSLFIIFNAFMVLTFIILFYSAAGVEESTTVTGIASGTLIGVWLFIGLPLALMSYLTRPKAYE